MMCKLTLICKLTCLLEPRISPRPAKTHCLCRLMLCTQPRINCICPQTSQALNLEETLRPKTAEPMTVCVPLLAGGSLVPCSRAKKATNSPAASIPKSFRLRDGDIATGDVHVPCMDGACARVAASLNRSLYLCPNPKQLPFVSPKPETLNPETESGTSGAGPWSPLYSSRYTHEC